MNQISSKLVEELVCYSDHPAHLKDTSGRYILSNDANTSLFLGKGMSSIVGSTIWDLNLHMKPLWGNMANDITFIEDNLKQSYKVYTKNYYPFLNVNGFIVIQSVKKYPILNSNNVVNSILSIGEIITDKINLFKLFKLYLQHHDDKYSGIQKFLEYLNILTYFHELPTEREVMILIARKYYYNPKLIATNFGIETKTVESHLYKIKMKLKNDINVVVLSMKLKS